MFKFSCNPISKIHIFNSITRSARHFSTQRLTKYIIKTTQSSFRHYADASTSYDSTLYGINHEARIRLVIITVYKTNICFDDFDDINM